MIQKPYIGNVRRFLLIRGTWKWNAWVRDITSKLEIMGFFRRDK